MLFSQSINSVKIPSCFFFIYSKLTVLIAVCHIAFYHEYDNHRRIRSFGMAASVMSYRLLAACDYGGICALDLCNFSINPGNFRILSPDMGSNYNVHRSSLDHQRTKTVLESFSYFDKKETKHKFQVQKIMIIKKKLTIALEIIWSLNSEWQLE